MCSLVSSFTEKGAQLQIHGNRCLFFVVEIVILLLFGSFYSDVIKVPGPRDLFI